MCFVKKLTTSGPVRILAPVVSGSLGDAALRILLASLCVLLSVWVPAWDGLAQSSGAEPGDPPLAALIDISAPDAAGVVTISGAPGAVFPSAQVAIRNLHTGALVYTTASFSGAFSAQIYGPGSTPFWISPAPSIPAARRDQPGSLPGGPGTIVTGRARAVPAHAAPLPAQAITQIMLDGQTDDWAAYPQAAIGNDYALLNADSLMVATRREAQPGEQLVIVFSLDASTYELAVDPTRPQAALLRQIGPESRDLGTRAVAVAVGEWVELRLSLRGLLAPFEAASLDSLFIRAGEDAERDRRDVGAPIARVDEIDGVVYPGGRMANPATTFSVAGSLAQGRSTWQAVGRVDALAPAPGDTITLELDVTLDLPGLAEALPGLALVGDIGLQPVTVGVDGAHNIPAMHTNNGWSNLFTLAGLPIDNLSADFALGTARVEPQQVVRRGDQLLAGFRFELNIPADLPPGIYVPVFSGRAQIGDSDLFGWAENSVIFGEGPDPAPPAFSRLPLVLNVGSLTDARLLWALLIDHPGDGSRGILPAADAERAALSNRVRFNSPTLILPPGRYPIEPYLLNQMPNAYHTTSAPLLPLSLPGGRLNASVTLPDGTVDALPGAPIVQNRLSTAALDERDAFGAQAPLDVYRLTTLNPVYSDYPFEAYGEYTINLSGSVEDVFGNRYGGGGEYRLLIAEPLKLLPGVLPGTPFHVGDAFYAGGQVLPGMPAAVSVRLTLVPVGGGDPVVRVYEGQANPDGVFVFGDEEAFVFDQPGEYVIDYEARYTLPDGRLWAASQRSAGIVAADGGLVARGVRGLSGVDAAYSPAWFTTATYPPAGIASGQPRRPHFPYHSGDVVSVPDSRASGILPALTVQDLDGAYADWLRGTLPGYVSAAGLSMDQLAVIDALPLLPVLGGPPTIYAPALLPDLIVNHAYAYISAVRPGVTVRQFVAGGDDAGLALHWDADDPLNRQIGAGVGGERPGDYTFLFGGAVVRNAEAGVRTTAAYAALAVTVGGDAPARVLPPFGAADGGPLLTIDGAAVETFFHPTAARPGQVFRVGDTLAIAGQAAPTVAADVTVTITAPSGRTTRFDGRTSPTGYFYQPQHDLPLDEPGRWTVRVNLSPAGRTSAGAVPPPLPLGGIPGAPDGVFSVYVANADDPPLAWSGGGDVDQATRPGSLQNLSIDVPAGWTEVSASFVVASPSYVLDAGALNVFGTSASYQLNPGALAQRFPNLEGDGRGEGPSASDVLTVTFAISGLDADGQRRVTTRTLTRFHDRLLTFEEFDRD